jgi:hypothetical protein
MLFADSHVCVKKYDESCVTSKVRQADYVKSGPVLGSQHTEFILNNQQPKLCPTYSRLTFSSSCTVLQENFTYRTEGGSLSVTHLCVMNGLFLQTILRTLDLKNQLYNLT